MNEKQMQRMKYMIAFSFGWAAMGFLASKVIEKMDKVYTHNLGQAHGAAEVWREGYEWEASKSQVLSKHVYRFIEEFGVTDADRVNGIAHDMQPDYVYVDANAPEKISQILQEQAEES